MHLEVACGVRRSTFWTLISEVIKRLSDTAFD
jgi:hypothetical protein